MPRSTIRLGVAGLASAVALAIVVGACSLTIGGATTSLHVSSTPSPGATATPNPTATALPQVQVQVIGEFSNAVAVGANTTGTATATCPNGMPLLSGGFIIRLDNANGEDGIPPNDSYPSASTTWKVAVSTQAGSVHLTAIAVCLKASFAVTTQIVHSSNGGGDTTVACPGGTTLTGGGFQSGGGTNAGSLPNGNGWKISTGVPFGGSANPTVYALCATGLSAGSVQPATKTVANGSVTANGAGCPADQYPVGGGYNGYLPGSDSFWHVFLNAPETGQGTISSGWMTEVHSGQLAASAFTVYSVCDKH